MRLIIDIVAGLLVAASLLLGHAHAQAPVVPYGQGASDNAPSPVVWTPVLLNGLGATVTAVKSNGPAKLAFIYCYNPTAAVAYLQIFDVATAAGVTLGVTTPKLSLGIPTAQASGLGPALIGINFLNGIQVASTTTVTGSSAASQNCNVAYN
jgi:hypothetical protein